ncbi:hypothetical protein HanIR_Chr14g0695841 [Helianthus annuus]|nr:hypothetical protein HanIR_Chr14g0695841 [Helianthus annuus]
MNMSLSFESSRRSFEDMMKNLEDLLPCSSKDCKIQRRFESKRERSIQQNWKDDPLSSLF